MWNTYLNCDSKRGLAHNDPWLCGVFQEVADPSVDASIYILIPFSISLCQRRLWSALSKVLEMSKMVRTSFCWSFPETQTCHLWNWSVVFHRIVDLEPPCNFEQDAMSSYMQISWCGWRPCIPRFCFKHVKDTNWWFAAGCLLLFLVWLVFPKIWWTFLWWLLTLHCVSHSFKTWSSILLLTSVMLTLFSRATSGFCLNWLIGK